MTSARNLLSRRDFLRRATLGLTGVLFALRHEQPVNESNQAGALLPFKADEFRLRLDNGRHLHLARLAQNKGTGRLLWLMGGEEADDVDGRGIRWGQPELLRVNEDAPAKGAALLAYLQEHHAEVLSGLWGQAELAELTSAGLLLDWDVQSDTAATVTVPAAELQGGFTLAGWFKVQPVETGDQLLLSIENEQLRLHLLLNPDRLTMLMTDDAGELRSETDQEMLADGDWHHVVFIADEDAGLLRWVVDGACQQTWTALSKPLPIRWEAASINLPQEGAMLGSLLVYNRPLRTAEAAASYRYYGQGMGSSAYWG